MNLKNNHYDKTLFSGRLAQAVAQYGAQRQMMDEQTFAQTFPQIAYYKVGDFVEDAVTPAPASDIRGFMVSDMAIFQLVQLENSVGVANMSLLKIADFGPVPTLRELRDKALKVYDTARQMLDNITAPGATVFNPNTMEVFRHGTPQGDAEFADYVAKATASVERAKAKYEEAEKNLADEISVDTDLSL